MHTRDSLPLAVLQNKAITIQKHYRGYRDRLRYNFIESDKENNQFYGFNGNDPAIDLSNCRLPYPTQNLALIGNSTLRSIEIACELGLPNQDRYTPTFLRIRNIIKRLGIENTVVYASNIAVCNDTH